MSPRAAACPRSHGRPDAARNEHDDRRQVAPKAHAAVHAIRPGRDGEREAKRQHQPEIGAKRGVPQFLPLAVFPIGVAALPQLGRRRFGWQTIELTLDLAELDCPIDVAQRSLLPFGDVASSPKTTARGRSRQRARAREPIVCLEARAPSSGRIAAPHVFATRNNRLRMARGV